MLVVAAVLGLRVWYSGVFRASESAPAVDSAAVQPLRHPLTGAIVETAIETPTVLAVMVDNSIDAWPQSGLDQAFLVIETLAEGRIPRFVAFYSADQTVEKIGPVRSARPYFIDWASAFGAVFAHVGGSPAALFELQSASVADLNQYYFGEYFWRSYDRYAPHNVYTSTELLNEAAAVRTDDEPRSLFWSFKEDAALDARGDQTEIATADFGFEEYFVEWSYDRESNTYVRTQGGSRILLQDGAEVIADNVVVMQTQMEVLDAIGRREIRTIGEGEARVYQDGIVIEATWKKETEEDPLLFFTAEGNEIKMNAGKTWIEVVE